MTLNDVITRLDAIATDRYPIITDSDIDALKIAIDIVKEKEEMSSISATQYGQIIEEGKTNVDTDTEQTENS